MLLQEKHVLWVMWRHVAHCFLHSKQVLVTPICAVGWWLALSSLGGGTATTLRSEGMSWRVDQLEDRLLRHNHYE